MRAIKRVILGLGSPPTATLNVTCRAVACDAVEVTWQPPEQPGHPPFHKYKLERQEVESSDDRSAPAAVWATAHGDLDDEDTQWVDIGLEVEHVFWGSPFTSMPEIAGS